MRIRGYVLVIAVTLVASSCGGSGEKASSISDQTAKTTTPALAAAGVDLTKVTFADATADDPPEVDAIDNNFDHQYTEIKAGSTLTFRNDGHNEHDVVPVLKGSFPGIKTEDFEPGTETKVTFDKPGDYPYYCSLHGTATKGMTGAIRVVK